MQILTLPINQSMMDLTVDTEYILDKMKLSPMWILGCLLEKGKHAEEYKEKMRFITTISCFRSPLRSIWMHWTYWRFATMNIFGLIFWFLQQLEKLSGSFYIIFNIIMYLGKNFKDDPPLIFNYWLVWVMITKMKRMHPLMQKLKFAKCTCW